VAFGGLEISLCDVPTRRVSEKVGSNRAKSVLILSKEKRKKFTELLLNSNGHPDCTHTLSDLPNVAFKKSESQFEYNYTLQIFHKENSIYRCAQNQ
jgi:hypothetical protein